MQTLSLTETVDAVRGDLDARQLPAPQVLYALGTGFGTLPSALGSRRSVELAGIDSVPEPWRDRELVSGTLGGARVWMIEDPAGDARLDGPGVPAWWRALPYWLAAASGAHVCVHTSAGIGLDTEPATGATPLASGTIALVRDHINCSGRSPLTGLGETRLGPLFPDQSRLHHPGLRSAVQRAAEERGISAAEAVVACTLGPGQSTPAELAWYARTGAHVAVQDLAGPLIGCAHAGLTALALVAVTGDGKEPQGIARILEQTEACAPALEDLVLASAEAAATLARALTEELG